MESDDDLIGKEWQSGSGIQFKVVNRFPAGTFCVQIIGNEGTGDCTMHAHEITWHLEAAKRRAAKVATDSLILQGSTNPNWQQMVMEDFETLAKPRQPTRYTECPTCYNVAEIGNACRVCGKFIDPF